MQSRCILRLKRRITIYSNWKILQVVIIETIVPQYPLKPYPKSNFPARPKCTDTIKSVEWWRLVIPYSYSCQETFRRWPDLCKLITSRQYVSLYIPAPLQPVQSRLAGAWIETWFRTNPYRIVQSPPPCGRPGLKIWCVSLTTTWQPLDAKSLPFEGVETCTCKLISSCTQSEGVDWNDTGYHTDTIYSGRPPWGSVDWNRSPARAFFCANLRIV